MKRATMMAVFASAGMTLALSGCLAGECSHLSDCGDGERCGADGLCTPDDDPLAVGSGARAPMRGPSGQGVDAPRATDFIPDASAGEDWSWVGWRVLGGVVRGTVAGMPLAPEGDFTPTLGVTVIAPGEGGDGLIVVNAVSPEDWTRVVTTPGASTFNSSDMGSPVYGAACTLNETSISHYDEPAQEIDILVQPEAADGTITIDVDVRNTLSNAGVTMRVARVE